MKLKKVVVEGVEYTVRRWSVAERLEFLRMLESSSGMSQSELYERQIEIVARNTGLSRRQIEEMDGVAVDLLLKEIVEFNTPPLAQSVQSRQQSTQAT